MHVLITGAAGMIGRKLADNLVRFPLDARRPLTRLTLADIVVPPAYEWDGIEGFEGNIERVAIDLGTPAHAERLVSTRPDLIFHLAAIVSGEAEADFEKGYRVNMAGTQALFEAIRKSDHNAWKPRVVFASSNAVFGGSFPSQISDDFHLTPQTSYGTQKAICELLLQDYSRRGFFDGIGIRLPTISVRPGKPNAAASGFFSGIIREPLVGMEAILPVEETTRHCMTGPRSAIGFLRHAAILDTARLGYDRNLNMPSISLSVGEQIEALGRVAGKKATALIRRVPDSKIATIVAGWASGFTAHRALKLGFVSETSYDEVIRAHIEDELGGTIAS